MPGFVKSEEAKGVADRLLKAANFGDESLTTVGWLQYWIYQCNSGIQPMDKEYKSETARDDQAFEDALKEKLGAARKKRKAKRKFKISKRKMKSRRLRKK